MNESRRSAAPATQRGKPLTHVYGLLSWIHRERRDHPIFWGAFLNEHSHTAPHKSIKRGRVGALALMS